jgi:hypothetical protein
MRDPSILLSLVVFDVLELDGKERCDSRSEPLGR